MNYLPKIFAVTTIALLGLPVLASAQGYLPLVDLPGVTKVGEAVDTSNYLAGMMKLIIALGGAIAIFTAILGGVQYVASGITPDAKSHAKERIQHAFIGLALILTSYLLLNSINPDLVNFKLVLPPIGESPMGGGGGVTANPTPASGTWPSDAAERTELASSPNSVSVNKANCVNVGDSNCTSVYGLQSYVITRIKDLKYQSDGTVIITGGTEYWLHRSHTGGTRVDLEKKQIVDAYIKSAGLSSSTSCGVSSDQHYQKNGAMYVDEPNRDSSGAITGTGRHWHVCY